jgi:hypothetical protein
MSHIENTKKEIKPNEHRNVKKKRTEHLSSRLDNESDALYN